MTNYNRQREYGAGCHVNPDDWNVDHREEPKSLIQNMQEGGLHPLHITCHDTSMELTFTAPLTSEQEITMDQIIATHKALVDWPPLPPEVEP